MKKYPHDTPHKYRRAWLDKAKTIPIFICVLPKCNHSMPLELVRDRTTLCWRCGAETKMLAWNLKLVRPHCQPKCEEKTEKLEPLGEETKLAELFKL